MRNEMTSPFSVGQAGFTLLEMLLVVLLTGIIFSLILPHNIIDRSDTFPIMFKELLTSAEFRAYSTDQPILIKIAEDGIHAGKKFIKLPRDITVYQETSIEIDQHGIMRPTEVIFKSGQEELIFKMGIFGISDISDIKNP